MNSSCSCSKCQKNGPRGDYDDEYHDSSCDCFHDRYRNSSSYHCYPYSRHPVRKCKRGPTGPTGSQGPIGLTGPTGPAIDWRHIFDRPVNARGFTLFNLPEPVTPGSAANKEYVDEATNPLKATSSTATIKDNGFVFVLFTTSSPGWTGELSTLVSGQYLIIVNYLARTASFNFSSTENLVVKISFILNRADPIVLSTADKMLKFDPTLDGSGGFINNPFSFSTVANLVAQSPSATLILRLDMTTSPSSVKGNITIGPFEINAIRLGPVTS